MRQDILVQDVIPYIQVWTGVIIAILIMMLYHFWRFEKQHPEIFQPDTTAERKQWRYQKAELRRQYHNRTMMSFVIVFVWMLGMMLICLGFSPTRSGWFMLVFVGLIILWIVSLMHRHPKK